MITVTVLYNYIMSNGTLTAIKLNGLVVGRSIYFFTAILFYVYSIRSIFGIWCDESYKWYHKNLIKINP